MATVCTYVADTACCIYCKSSVISLPLFCSDFVGADGQSWVAVQAADADQVQAAAPVGLESERRQSQSTLHRHRSSQVRGQEQGTLCQDV